MISCVTEWTAINADKFSIRKDQNLSLIAWSLLNLGQEDDGSKRLIEATSKHVLAEMAQVSMSEERLPDTTRLFHHLANYAHSLLILAPDRTDLMSEFIQLCSGPLQRLKDEGVIGECHLVFIL